MYLTQKRTNSMCQTQNTHLSKSCLTVILYRVDVFGGKSYLKSQQLYYPLYFLARYLRVYNRNSIKSKNLKN